MRQERYETGEDVIDAYGLDGDIVVSAVVLLAMFVVLIILAYVVLLLKVRNRCLIYKIALTRNYEHELSKKFCGV